MAAARTGALASRTRCRSLKSRVRWKGAGGDEVDGLLYYPHKWQPNRRYPLVVQIHGGPASSDRDEWDEDWAYSANLYCQRGAFVLRPNYHGSAGYGLTWLESMTNGHVVLSDGTTFEADTVVWTAGVKANPLALKSGMPIDYRGRLICSDTLQARGLQGIWGAGDSAAGPILQGGRRLI